MEENKRGGKRLGAGRKPVLNKKKQISLYVENSAIIPFGNEEKMKAELYEFILGYKKADYGYGSVPLPKDYLAVQNVAILKPDGTTEPLSFDKMRDEDNSKPSYLQLLNGMAKVTFADEKEDYALKIHAATHLSQKQRTDLLNALKNKP